MKLLFDQNLSFKLCQRLFDVFPGSSHVELAGLEQATDRAVWDYARANAFAIVSFDSDFAELAALFGAPPKVIWLRCGNQPTDVIERLLRDHAALATSFDSADAACFEIYGAGGPTP